LNNLGPANLDIYDVNGRKVYSRKENISGTFRLNLTNLSDGLYILNIKGDNFRVNKKILIE
jgi:extracellular elastinolytic metalloproteinase